MSGAQAEMTVKEFRRLAQAAPNTLNTYLDGLTEGVMWSDRANIIQGRSDARYFCIPTSLPLTNDTAKHLILNAKTIDDKEFAVTVLLRELRWAFPCKS